MSEYQSVPDTGDDLDNESVEVLRARLNEMKRLMSERTAQIQQNPATTEQVWSTKRYTTTGVIDGNFLSVAFGGALMVIISVSVYAFYNLYHAVLKNSLHITQNFRIPEVFSAIQCCIQLSFLYVAVGAESHNT